MVDIPQLSTLLHKMLHTLNNSNKHPTPSSSISNEEDTLNREEGEGEGILLLWFKIVGVAEEDQTTAS